MSERSPPLKTPGAKSRGKPRGMQVKSNRLIDSMSRKGNCWDSAIADSFFHTLKVELVYTQQYATCEQAKQSIFQYIEAYYNQCRLHSAIDYRAPFEFECAC